MTAVEKLLLQVRDHERVEAEKRILLAESFGWTGFFAWHDEPCTANDLMGYDPKGEPRPLPELSEAS